MKGTIFGVVMALAAIAGGLMAAQPGTIQFLKFFGPATAATPSALLDFNHTNGSADVTIAGVTGQRQCLTELDAIATGAYTLQVLDAGTTVYALTLAANTGIVRDWSPETAPCSSSGNRLEIKVSTTSVGTYQINYAGYAR